MRNLPKLNTTAKESAPLVSLEQLLVDVIGHEQLLVDVLSGLNRNRLVTEKDSVALMSQWCTSATQTYRPAHHR